MQTLDHSAYLALRSGAEVLEADSHGDKVLRLPNGNFLKLFRRKRLISSATIWPYAQRFANNASTLQTLGIPCPTIIAVYRIESIQRDAVYYAPLPGQTLRQEFQQGVDREHLRSQLGQFVAELHNLGLYFRSLHLGNIVLTPDNALGLIDIADLKHQQRPLNNKQRLRNFKHILRYAEDKQWLLEGSSNIFFQRYVDSSKIKLEISEHLRALGITENIS